jgi:hypothetical protein
LGGFLPALFYEKQFAAISFQLAAISGQAALANLLMTDS